MVTDLNYNIQKQLYRWVTNPYFNNRTIQIGDIGIMTSSYSSSGSFGSRVRSKSIGQNTYTG